MRFIVASTHAEMVEIVNLGETEPQFVVGQRYVKLSGSVEFEIEWPHQAALPAVGDVWILERSQETC